MTPTNLRFRALVAALAALPFAACGGAGGPDLGPEPAAAQAPAGAEALLLRVEHHADLGDVAAEMAADGWSLARTQDVPPSAEGDGAVLCVFEAIAGVAPTYPEDGEPVVAAEKRRDANDRKALARASRSERVRRLRCRRGYGGDQSYVPIFDDDVNFLAYATQPALDAVGAVDSRLETAGEGVVVAVLDGGFDLDHEALDGRLADGGYDAVSNDDDPRDPGDGVDGDLDGVTDGFVGHGTAVASLVLAVAPHARIVPIRVLDDEGWGTTASVALGMLAAIDSGAKVINLSAHADRSSGVIADLVVLARSRGILVVASAGNGGQWDVGFPASLSDVAAIGGSAEDGTYDEDSDHGPEVDASAPMRGLLAPFPGTTDGYGRWTGTSMSAALWSGGVAAMLSGTSGYSPALVSEVLTDETTPYPSVPYLLRNRVGSGVLNVAAAIP
jgi:subtilisin family serine protease